jgi:hypothetical protein
VTLGLVGLHIAHKTTHQQNWVWATFEHVKNVTKSFNNPSCSKTPSFTADPLVPCTQACCPPNTQTAAAVATTTGKYYEELNAQGEPLHKPTQVTRVAPIEATEENVTYQALLSGTVWANYQLISTQWSGNLGDPPIHPLFLANTTMETFNQGPTPPTDGEFPYPDPRYKPFFPQVSSSCIKCHSKAPTAVETPANFSFLLGDAQQ